MSEKCWEFMSCEAAVKEKCPAYTSKSEEPCWVVAANFCPRAKRQYKQCFDCPWFKNQNLDFEEEAPPPPSEQKKNVRPNSFNPPWK